MTSGASGEHAIGGFPRTFRAAAGAPTPANLEALLFELRAATSLFRVRPKATRERLARLVGHFAPEDDCVDLRAAVALLGI